MLFLTAFSQFYVEKSDKNNLVINLRNLNEIGTYYADVSLKIYLNLTMQKVRYDVRVMDIVTLKKLHHLNCVDFE